MRPLQRNWKSASGHCGSPTNTAGTVGEQGNGYYWIAYHLDTCTKDSKRTVMNLINIKTRAAQSPPMAAEAHQGAREITLYLSNVHRVNLFRTVLLNVQQVVLLRFAKELLQDEVTFKKTVAH